MGPRADDGVRHGRAGQFHRVSPHLHGPADRGDSLRGAVGATGRGSPLHLLSETFAVDETSKRVTQGLASIALQTWCVYGLASWQGHNARRLLDPDDGALDHHPSSSRKEPASGTDHKVVMLNLR